MSGQCLLPLHALPVHPHPIRKKSYSDPLPPTSPSLIILENRLYWPVDDPAEATGSEAEQLDAFRKARDEIREKLETWLASLG